MTFRIIAATGDEGETLQIAGRLERDGLRELERALAAASRPLTIDLRDLQHADRATLTSLARLESGGVRLVGASQYLRLQLERAAADDVQS